MHKKNQMPAKKLNILRLTDISPSTAETEDRKKVKTYMTKA